MLGKLIRGTPGHPLHPPLTDATIGMYTLAAVLAVVGALGWIEEEAAVAMWLALVVGLVVTVPTALSGLADWLQISPGTPLRRTATTHLLVMLSATVFFALAAWRQWSGYEDGEVTAGGLLFTLVGFALLTLGGWIGGSIVYVHGMRVLELAEALAREAISPEPQQEQEQERR